MILPLGPAPVEIGEVGGKAAGLARLLELGFPVPPAVVVPVSDAGGIRDPDGVIAGLGEPLAVRSSAVSEDAADRSSAGQYESVMGVRLDGLASAVRRVHSSARSERVRAYRGEDDQAGMAVIIQREIPAGRAGVAFSRDPLSSHDAVLIECVFGHGEALVSGRATPDRYRVEQGGGVSARLAVKPPPHRLLRSLRDDEAAELAGLARLAEERFAQAVDVEFCFEGTRLWLVQCRAITALTSRR